MLESKTRSFPTCTYSRDQNNSVVLNKRVRGIFLSRFVGENACFGENFESYLKLAINELLYLKNAGAQISMFYISNE